MVLKLSIISQSAFQVVFAYKYFVKLICGGGVGYFLGTIREQSFAILSGMI